MTDRAFSPVEIDHGPAAARTVTVEANGFGVVIVSERWADPVEDEDMDCALYVSPDEAEQLACVLQAAARAARPVYDGLGR